MTDAPRTTMLFAEEWRALCVGGAQQLAGFFANVPHPTATELAAFDAHVDRLRMFVQAWSATPAPQVQAAPNPFDGAAPQGNGASEPKRKGGWPKGRSRKLVEPPASEPIQ